MRLGSSIRVKIGSLVHPSALPDPVNAALHRTILAARLLTGLAVLSAGPLLLAGAGAPKPWAAVAYCALLVPLASATLLSRTGRLGQAQALTAASFLAFAMTLGLWGGPLSGAAYVWLALAPIEAAFSMKARLALSFGVAAVLCALVLLRFGDADASLGSGAQRVEGAVLILSALAYAAQAAVQGARVARGRERMERLGAARFETLAGALGDLVLHHDRSGAVISASRESETLFGLASRELAGRGFFERVHVGDRPAFLSAVADAAACDRTIATTLRLRVSQNLDGEPEEPRFAWIEMRARRLAAPGENGATVFAVVRDVTNVKRREKEIEEARLEAEQAVAWKDRFLANISHELRTPLNGIIGFSEMLCSEELAPRDPAKRQEYAQIIRSSGQHLLSVVNSILDMSKIEAGRFDILLEPFEIAPLVESCCDIVRLKAEQGGVELARMCPRDLPELVADKRACKQILINLLSNAIKFTASGGRVTVGARVEGASMVLFVCDTGVGIGARDLPHIGSAFFQARSAYDRPFEGTGLGLSVVRGLVGLHGGTIQLESAPSEGTCVTVRLPRDGRPILATVTPAKIETIARAAPRAVGFPIADEPSLQPKVKEIA